MKEPVFGLLFFCMSFLTETNQKISGDLRKQKGWKHSNSLCQSHKLLDAMFLKNHYKSRFNFKILRTKQ